MAYDPARRRLAPIMMRLIQGHIQTDVKNQPTSGVACDVASWSEMSTTVSLMLEPVFVACDVASWSEMSARKEVWLWFISR